MTTLVEFLKARLDEDEQAARGALPGPWLVDRSTYNDGRGLRILNGPGLSVTWTPGFYERGDSDAEHIARHDPARVLAEVEAKRARLHIAMAIQRGDTIGIQSSGDPDMDAALLMGMQYAAKLMLATDALPYADHPDYREEWRP